MSATCDSAGRLRARTSGSGLDGVAGLGFRVWGLGFRVLGFGFGIFLADPVVLNREQDYIRSIFGRSLPFHLVQPPQEGYSFGSRLLGFQGLKALNLKPGNHGLQGLQDFRGFMVLGFRFERLGPRVKFFVSWSLGFGRLGFRV